MALRVGRGAHHYALRALGDAPSRQVVVAYARGFRRLGRLDREGGVNGRQAGLRVIDVGIVVASAVHAQRQFVRGEGPGGRVVGQRRVVYLVEAILRVALTVGIGFPAEGVEIHVARAVGGVAMVHAHILPFLQFQLVALDRSLAPQVLLRSVQAAEEDAVALEDHADLLGHAGVARTVVAHLVRHGRGRSRGRGRCCRLAIDRHGVAIAVEEAVGGPQSDEGRGVSHLDQRVALLLEAHHLRVGVHLGVVVAAVLDVAPGVEDRVLAALVVIDGLRQMHLVAVAVGRLHGLDPHLGVIDGEEAKRILDVETAVVGLHQVGHAAVGEVVVDGSVGGIDVAALEVEDIMA